MASDALYPWLNKHWQQLQSLKQQDRLPHALMLRGISGLGIRKLAQQLAHALLCQSPTESGYACGQCSDCQLIKAKTHPDLHYITVAEDKKQISVDQIRSLVNVCIERPHQGGYRLVVIDPSEAMNLAAANALLKTLEEPGDDTLLILVANASNALPATIRSRCQLMSVEAPTEQQGYDWIMQHHPNDRDQVLLSLKLSALAPLKAVNFLNSEQIHTRTGFMASLARAADQRLEPVNLAATISKHPMQDIISWMYSLALDAKKYHQQLPSEKLLNSDQLKLIALLASRPVERLDAWIDRLLESRRLLGTSSNINPQLIAEDLMFRWIAIFK